MFAITQSGFSGAARSINVIARLSASTGAFEISSDGEMFAPLHVCRESIAPPSSQVPVTVKIACKLESCAAGVVSTVVSTISIDSPCPAPGARSSRPSVEQDAIATVVTQSKKIAPRRLAS